MGKLIVAGDDFVPASVMDDPCEDPSDEFKFVAPLVRDAHPLNWIWNVGLVISPVLFLSGGAGIIYLIALWSAMMVMIAAYKPGRHSVWYKWYWRTVVLFTDASVWGLPVWILSLIRYV